MTFGNSLVSGNMGLRDQLLALHWVKNNIQSYGGDPDKVGIWTWTLIYCIYCWLLVYYLIILSCPNLVQYFKTFNIVIF